MLAGDLATQALACALSGSASTCVFLTVATEEPQYLAVLLVEGIPSEQYLDWLFRPIC